jgi:ribosomal protein S18 acetylase RimI-like enzyme
MSEYYSIRRTSIKDMTALLAFVVGWLGSAPLAWPFIKAGFESGNVTSGVFRFAVIVFSAAIACGALGLGVGALGGWAWERWHRRWRVTHPHAAVTDATLAPGVDAAPRVALPPLPPIAYDDRPVTPQDYGALALRMTGESIDASRATRALAQSVNIGAWDGERLVGLARLVSDGYSFAALAELAVDPAYQRRGMGRELMHIAFEKTPRGSLFIGAPFGNVAFFDRLGCERNVTGFTMRRSPRRQPPA